MSGKFRAGSRPAASFLSGWGAKHGEGRRGPVKLTPDRKSREVGPSPSHVPTGTREQRRRLFRVDYPSGAVPHVTDRW